jgi:UPF0755 protein
MRRFIFFILIIFLLMGLVGGGVFVWGFAQYIKPGPTISENTVYIPEGSSVDSIANILESEGVIDDAMIFRLGVRLSRVDKGLKAGEFAFSHGVSAKGAAQILVNGKTVTRRLTIAEGLTAFQVFDQLVATNGLEDTFDVPLEGSVFPETYYFSYGDTRSELIKRMVSAMDNNLNRLWQERASGLPFNEPSEALILASIVEKETGVKAERARIAGIFINRLKKGMRLQSDPTVVYGLSKGDGPLGRSLMRADLKKKTPYNTYTIHGLPPGPICNPGLAAIRAVLNPQNTDELYFVADGKGGHVFTKNLKEHNRNAVKWRKIRDAN